MALHRFFVESALEPDGAGTLTAEQARQIRSVLRLREGDSVVLFDGSGVEASARLTVIRSAGAEFQITGISRPLREPSLAVTVGLALLRGERFEIALQKLTELGVRRIVPLAADHCVVTYRKPGEWEKKAVRFRRIIVEALEQSERVTDTVLDSPTSLDAFLNQHTATVLTERSDARPLALHRFKEEAALAIGPEGGWSARERKLIAEHGTEASLGGLILRAETAAIVAAAIVIQQHVGIEAE